MLKNYLKTTLRSLLRKKGYSFINVAGLTLGLASCLLVFQYVAFEYSFDRFHEHERDLYRVLLATPPHGESFEPGGAFTGFGLAPALFQSVPEVLRVARLHPEYGPATVSSPSRPDRVFEERRIFYADPAFLEMFTFPLVEGISDHVLEPGTALVSESIARKYFGAESATGEVLDVAGQITRGYRIAGVFRDVPANTHLQFDVLLPIDDLLREAYANEPEGGFSWNNFLTYVQLHPGADPATVDPKMTQAYVERQHDVLDRQGRHVRVWTQTLRDVHLNDSVVTPLAVTGSYRTVYFFSMIGLAILLIALANYVNLATARTLDRAREVGVRKVVGAQRRQLVAQFLCESALTNGIAAVFAVVLAVLATPLVNALAETQLTAALWTNASFWGAFLAIFGTCTLLAGLYPAFVLSSFTPVVALKGKAGAAGSRNRLRQGLVVVQFATSVVLIAGTAVVYDQLTFMRRMDLGLELEEVLAVDGPRVLPDGMSLPEAVSTFAEELRRLPAVQRVATSTSLPGLGFNWNSAAVRRAADDPAETIRGVVTYVDTSFAALYGLELVAGEGFRGAAAPETGTSPVIANETTVRSLGFETPAAAIGEPLDVGGWNVRIIGVVRDVNWTSAHVSQENVLFGRTDGGQHVSIRVATYDLPGLIASIESLYGRLFPGNVFRYAFVDETFDRQYRNERRFAALFAFFAGLAIVIACLGLFGLASFATQQRTKEVGVRKVLGATVPGLAGLLSRDFLQLVVLAVVIASPVAYVLMQRWLEGFAYRVEIRPALFLGVGFLAVLIALVTVAWQSIRAAMADPIRSLRSE